MASSKFNCVFFFFNTVFRFDKTDLSTKSPTESTKATEVELRLRVRRINEDNTWLREELMRTEELSANYQQQFYSMRQRYEKINDKYNQFERENEEQKELLNNMKKEETRYQVALEKTEKERKKLFEKSETQGQIISSLKEKLEKLINDKINYNKQLNTFKTKLAEKDVACDILQEKIDQVTELNINLEEYYEKTIQQLQEENSDLKNENNKLQSRLSIGVPSVSQIILLIIN